MSEASSTSRPTTCAEQLSFTLSPESESGATPSDSLGGPTRAPSGLARVRVNLSPRRVGARARPTSVTSGQRGSSSSESAALSSFLESRLRAVTASLGSTLYELTWKERVMPSGRSIPALRATARRTSDSGSSLSGWGTPTATVPGGTPEQALTRKLRSRGRIGASVTSLAHQVQLIGSSVETESDGPPITGSERMASSSQSSPRVSTSQLMTPSLARISFQA